MVRPSPVTTVPPITNGARVRELGAVQRCFRSAGTATAAVGLGAVPVAGWNSVVRTELRHQTAATSTATAAAIAAAARRSPLVRRSGRIIGVGSAVQLS